MAERLPSSSPTSDVQILFLGSREGFESVSSTVGDRARVVHVKADKDELRAALPDADALVDASMVVRINDEMIAAAPRLKIISCATTGADHVERTEASSRGIPVRTLREDSDLLAGLTPAAELSWALLMACARRLIPATEHVKSGAWERERFPGIMLKGKQLGLIGVGRIGKWMARYAAAFSMSTVGHDPHLSAWPDGVDEVSLDQLARTSDFISIHVPLTEETHRLVDADFLRSVKRGAVLVNTSRGSVMDEEALLDVLNAGLLGAAGLDVLDGEPDIAHHPLVEYARTHENLIITPHCGGFSPEAVRLVCERAAEKVLAHLGLDEKA